MLTEAKKQGEVLHLLCNKKHLCIYFIAIIFLAMRPCFCHGLYSKQSLFSLHHLFHSTTFPIPKIRKIANGILSYRILHEQGKLVQIFVPD